jgi:hypothetical protein
MMKSTAFARRVPALIPKLVLPLILALVPAMTLLTPEEADGQVTPRQRAEQTLPPEVFSAVSGLATELAASGVPSGPLFNKALEGMAKRVPANRLLPAVRAYGSRLGQARTALGESAAISLVVAGADAIQRGVPTEALRSLPRDRPRSPVALLVLAELMESGVPADRAVAVLRQSMDQRMQDGRMLDIPAQVRRLIRAGVPPREAMDRVRRAMQRARGRHFGPALPVGDRPISDRRLRDAIRRIG